MMVPEGAAAHAFGPRAVERGRELAGESLHPLVDVGERRGELRFERRTRTRSQPRHEQKEERRAAGGECDGRNHEPREISVVLTHCSQLLGIRL